MSCQKNPGQEDCMGCFYFGGITPFSVICFKNVAPELPEWREDLEGDMEGLTKEEHVNVLLQMEKEINQKIKTMMKEGV